MKRRIFNQTSASLILSSPFQLLVSPIQEFSNLNSALLPQLVKANDDRIEAQIKNQNKDIKHPSFGGIKDRYGMYSAGSVAGFIKNLSCSYAAMNGQYFQSKSLIKPLFNASNFLNSIQYKDGTIDLLTTNFHSTPDTAFVVEPIAIAYSLLHKNKSAEILPVLNRLKIFLIKAGKALMVGGIHTPNHRWVLCMALARIHHLFPNPRYLSRIDQWLAEGIDIDEDGQYHEKSTYIYSPIVNKCLIRVAKYTGKEELLEPVRRNLEMTLFYRHANGEIATESSGRQDRYQRGTMQAYYYPYRYMALHDKNARFSAMAQHLEKSIPQQLGRWLGAMLEDEKWLLPLPAPASLPSNYYKVFLGAKTIRYGRGKADASILLSNPAFFTYFNGKAALEAIRMASAFFGKGQFEALEWEEKNGSWILSQKLEGPYYQPLDKEHIPEDGDWNKMPRSLRKQSEIQVQTSTIIIKEKKGLFEIEIDISGTDHVPVAIELAFRKGGQLSGVIPSPHNIENAFLSLPEQDIIYELEGDQIKVSAGPQAHSWTQLRGALPKLDAMSVYLTGYTPFREKLTIKAIT